MNKTDVSKWQIVKCIYDYLGMFYNEIEEPEETERYIKEKGDDCVGWFIGIVHELDDGRKCTEVLLEGNKEILEFVLDNLRNYYL